MFSIVIPLYNKAHTILSTVQSVLNQTFPEFEIVIVNDGSTDNGVQLIEQHFTDSRIRIIDQKNQGASAARNNGVNMATNELIAFLDGDDQWLPDFLMKMKESVTLFPNAGMYCCAGFIKYLDGNQVVRASEKYGNRIQEINFFENPYFFSNSSSTVIRKSEFNKTDGFPVGMKVNEDLVFFWSLALLVPVVYCPTPLTVYFRRNKNIKVTSRNITFDSHFVSRINQVFQNWLKTDRDNKMFLIFTRFEVRSELLRYLKKNEYQRLNYFFENIDKRLLSYFPPLELYAYKVKWLRPALMIYIYFTKAVRRVAGVSFSVK